MRVLVLGVAATPETFLQRLFAGLRRAGVEVRIGVDGFPSPRSTDSTRTSLPPRGGGLRRQLARRAWAAMQGRPLVKTGAQALRLEATRRIDPDVVYFPWNSAAIEDLPLLQSGIPTVVSCRGSQVLVAPWDPHRVDMRDRLSESFASATAVHCVSNHIAHEAERYGLDRAKSRVIRPAVDTTVFTPPSQKRRADTFHIVTTGSMIWRKGHEFAVVALQRLGAMGIDADLTIIGGGPDRDRVLYTAHDVGVADRLQLLGRCSPDEVVARLQAADLFWLTSMTEGISNAALEAMACGLPVVTTDVGGMREAVEDGVEGFLVPPRDADAVAEATAILVRDVETAARMGSSARLRVERQFRLDDQVRAFEQLFRDAAGGSA